MMLSLLQPRRPRRQASTGNLALSAVQVPTNIDTPYLESSANLRERNGPRKRAGRKVSGRHRNSLTGPGKRPLALACMDDEHALAPEQAYRRGITPQMVDDHVAARYTAHKGAPRQRFRQLTQSGVNATIPF